MLVAQSQEVGINTDSPKATLDISTPSEYTNQKAGLSIPQLTGDQIESMITTELKIGTLIYATSVSTATTKDITHVGYWMWTGDTEKKWEPFGDVSAIAKNQPWKKLGTAEGATSHRDSVYLKGTVLLGVDSSNQNAANMSVPGDVETPDIHVRDGSSLSVYGEGHLISDNQVKFKSVTTIGPRFFNSIVRGNSVGGNIGEQSSISFAVGNETELTSDIEKRRATLVKYGPTTSYNNLKNSLVLMNNGLSGASLSMHNNNDIIFRQNLRFNSNSYAVMIRGGNVGIGIVPVEKLHVDGRIKIGDISGGTPTIGETNPVPGTIRYNSTADKFQGYVRDTDPSTAELTPGWVNLN